MSVTCEHCKKPIESKADLLVMRKWWLFPKPLHKACWGSLAAGHGGAGSVSYQTGAFQGKRQWHIAINSTFFSILTIVAILLAIFIIFADFSKAITTVNGVQRAPTVFEILLVKTVASLILMVPIVQRVWSYFSIEKNVA